MVVPGGFCNEMGNCTWQSTSWSKIFAHRNCNLSLFV